MRNKKCWISSIIVTVMLLIFVGTVMYLNRFDAVAYTQAVLDVSYKNEIKGYIEQTGAEKEEAQEVFQRNLDAAMEQFKTQELNEELEKKYQELFEEIVRQVKYTVLEAFKDEKGNYEVSVEVEPILLFDDTYESFQEAAREYATEISNQVMAGEEMPTEDAMQEHLYQIYYEILNENMEKGLKYGEAQSVVLHITKENLFTYEISEEDLQALNSLLISKDKLQ